MEILVATTIAAAGYFALYGLSSQCMRQIWSARELSRAMSVIEYEMDYLRTANWSDFDARTNYTISSSTNLALARLPGGGGSVSLTTGASIKTARVSVVWSIRNGAAMKTQSVACVISEEGFYR